MERRSMRKYDAVFQFDIELPLEYRHALHVYERKLDIPRDANHNSGH